MPFVLFDVDGVVVDYDGKLRPGARELMIGFAAMGYEIRMWSGNGCEHASDVAEKYDLPCESFTTKPPYPMTRTSVVNVMAGTPSLQFDDDYSEYVGDWPFVHIHCAGKMPGRTKKVK